MFTPNVAGFPEHPNPVITSLTFLMEKSTEFLCENKFTIKIFRVEEY